MPYALKLPDPQTLIATEPKTGARLYAELAEVPLYATVRLIGKGIVGRRESFRLGWIIEDKRIANGHDAFKLPAALVEWAAAQMAEAYPDHATATGLSAEEVSALKREQAEKRKKYEK